MQGNASARPMTDMSSSEVTEVSPSSLHGICADSHLHPTVLYDTVKFRYAIGCDPLYPTRPLLSWSSITSRRERTCRRRAEHVDLQRGIESSRYDHDSIIWRPVIVVRLHRSQTSDAYSLHYSRKASRRYTHLCFQTCAVAPALVNNGHMVAFSFIKYHHQSHGKTPMETIRNGTRRVVSIKDFLLANL